MAATAVIVFSISICWPHNLGLTAKQPRREHVPMTDIPSPVPEPVTGAAAPPVSRAFYGMPMFATLLVSDLERTTSWYTDGLGFINLFTLRGPDGLALVHFRRWQFQDLMARQALEQLSAGNGCSLSFAAVYDEIDDLAARARAHGAGQVDGPTDTAWNTRDLTTIDPDGHVVVFTAGLPVDRDGLPLAGPTDAE